MDSATFDALTRRAAAVPTLSRRSSLFTLGGAALGAAIAAPSSTRAGKAGKKAKQKCKKQVGKCKTVVEQFCSQFSAGAQECENAVFPCCEFLKGCNAGNATECFIEELFNDMMMK